MSRRKTTEECVNDFIKVNGHRYDYSLVDYNKAHSKVDIVCLIHGVFQQYPTSHLRGVGCKECSKLSISIKNSKDIKHVIPDFIKTHGDRYDYSKVKYKGSNNKIIIICKKHGEFKQTPGKHLYGQGCPDCGNIAIGIKKSHNNIVFIEKSKLTHQGSYGYTRVHYKNAHTKVEILCHLHGIFNQTPDAHLQGQGCPKCANISRSEYNRKNHGGWSAYSWGMRAEKSKYFDSFKVYVIKCWNDEEVFYKIGRTFRKTKIRFLRKRTLPYNYEIIKEFVFETSKEAYEYEVKLKREHKPFRYVPLLFFCGKNECFTDYYFPDSN